MWPIGLPMHSVCFAFVPKQNGGRIKFEFGTRFVLAAKGLQVRVNIFAGVDTIDQQRTLMMGTIRM